MTARDNYPNLTALARVNSAGGRQASAALNEIDWLRAELVNQERPMRRGAVTALTEQVKTHRYVADTLAEIAIERALVITGLLEIIDTLRVENDDLALDVAVARCALAWIAGR